MDGAGPFYQQACEHRSPGMEGGAFSVRSEPRAAAIRLLALSLRRML
jgi:hypothetical protein